jgi:hypothetical protein
MTRTVTDPKHQRSLSREFGIRQGYVAPEVEPTIQPTALVADLTQSDLLSDAPFIRRCFGNAAVTGDATHPPLIWLANPAGSTNLLVVRRVITACDPGGDSIQVGMVLSAAAPAATASAKGSYFNRRLSNAAGTASGQVNSNTTVARPLMFNLAFFTGSAVSGQLSQPHIEGIDMVLVPVGDVLMCSGTANATFMSASFWWDEIPLGQA